MLPGPDHIFKCPYCGNYLKRRSLMSGNTIGAILYSDGKFIAPMMPELPDLTKCKKCNSIFWLGKLKKIETAWNDQQKLDWQNADYAEFLKIDDYYNAISQGIAQNDREECVIRQLLWWAYNDRTRKNQKIFIDEKDELRWKENITELIKLLDQSDHEEKVMIAELHRNSGDFEGCISIINDIHHEKLNWLKEKLISECKKKNRWVIKLK